MIYPTNTHGVKAKKYCRIQLVFMLCMLFVFFTTYSQEKKTGENLTSTSNEELLNKYINSKAPAIVFDETNIKQFWVDNSVFAKDNFINIFLDEKESNRFESRPLKIQLANVNEEQVCRIEIFSCNSNISFSVFDNNGIALANSQNDDSFIDYCVSFLSFSLEDTSDLTFNLKFQSSLSEVLALKKILLSFPTTQSGSLKSSRMIRYNLNNLKQNPAITEINEKEFSISGKNKTVYSAEKIPTDEGTLSYSIKIKNIGDVATTVRVGFAPYSKDDILLNDRFYPYNRTNQVLNIISSSEQSNIIIVDYYPEWHKNCVLAVDAKDDMSDIPNPSWTEGRIVEVKKIDNAYAEITLDKPLTKKMEKGEKVRINGFMSATICPIIEQLQPGEEVFFSESIKKDMSEKFFSHEHFSRDVDYVIPLIMISSADSEKESTIQIKNFRISY